MEYADAQRIQAQNPTNTNICDTKRKENVAQSYNFGTLWTSP